MSQLDPNDIQQTNNALAHQLAMLTLMNEYKKNERQTASEGQYSHEQQEQETRSGIGYVPNVGLGVGLSRPSEANPISASFASAGHSNVGAGES